jgi:general secretion pathway protein N
VSPTSSFRSRFGAPRRAAEARPDARPRHWAWAGAALGLLVALPMTLPAAWMAGLVSLATDGRLQLAEAEGPWWNGSALPVLTGGPGSRDASVLPSRLHWRVGLHWNGLSLTLSQPCCAAAPFTLRWQAGWRQQRVSLDAASGELLGQWPASWLIGLGAPWNTLRPDGQLRLSSHGLTLLTGPGGWSLQGQAQAELLQASSRLVPLDSLGSYRLQVFGQPAGAARISLQTLEGALLLQGQGEWREGQLHFQGQAQAAEGQEPVLNNLLNIIGRRQGARSIISIG